MLHFLVFGVLFCFFIFFVFFRMMEMPYFHSCAKVVSAFLLLFLKSVHAFLNIWFLTFSYYWRSQCTLQRAMIRGDIFYLHFSSLHLHWRIGTFTRARAFWRSLSHIDTRQWCLVFGKGSAARFVFKCCIKSCLSPTWSSENSRAAAAERDSFL